MGIRFVIGVDPSGSFYEGKGKTGIAVYDIKKDKILDLKVVSANYAHSQVDYWKDVVKELDSLLDRFDSKVCVLAIEEYKLYANAAKMQINSSFETPQLIGILKYHFTDVCPILFRSANRAKKRWDDKTLVRLKYIHADESIGYYLLSEDGIKIQAVDHSRDAIRHALCCGKFEIKDGKVCNI